MPAWAEIMTGAWSYRAFKNDEDLAVPFNDLRFATATLTLKSLPDDAVSGTLKGEGWGTWIEWGLDLTGARAGEAGFRFQGVNEIQGDKWVYTYQGALLETLSAASNKRFIITGTVMRSLARVNVPGEAGEHATFIAVKRDHYPD
jgi:hypothetical protein